MTGGRDKASAALFRALTWVLYTLIFGLSHTQDVLFSSNQNTKFLHGMADAGVGFLANDWLARTVDPLPCFSFLIRVVYGHLHEYSIYIFFFILVGAYLYGMMGIADRLFRVRESRTKELAFLALFTLAHSVLIPPVSKLLTEGVAEQYLSMHYLQPCVFGMLMFPALYLFMEKKRMRAMLIVCVSAWFHTAYLFTAGLFVCSFMLVEYLETRSFRKPAVLGAVALVCVLPVIAYNMTALAPESAAAHRQALAIIVNEIIPFHSLIAVWFQWTVIVKVAMICAALWLIRSNRALLITVLITFSGGVIFTLIQAATRDLSLALLAPWRVSAFLVPLATAIILARLVSVLNGEGMCLARTVTAVSLCVMLLTLARGVRQEYRYVYRALHGPTVPVMEHVRRNKSPGDVYLVPNRERPLFKFRLYTGAPIFINWKSHPYRDGEVLEWRRRNTLADAFYGEGDRSERLMREFVKGGVTHIVLPRDSAPPAAPDNERVYADRHYCVYHVADR